MMKFAIAPLLILAATLTGCVNFSGWQTVHGSGNILTEPREVQGFDRVTVSGSGELTVEQGAEESLVIEADDNLLSYIRSEIDGRHLSIGPHNVNLRPTDRIRYRLHVKNLNELHLSGSLRAEIGTLRTERLRLHISGSGDIRIQELDTETLSARVSGSGKISAAGRATTQEIRISGSGDHLTPQLKSSQADAQISGSGHASLWVVDTLNAHISGSGRVEYRGHPSVDSHISGSGRVRRMADAER